MELRRTAATNFTRLFSAGGAIALVLAAVIVLAGRAEADRDSSHRGDHAQRVVADLLAATERGRPASSRPRPGRPVRKSRPHKRVAARSDRAQHSPAKNPEAPAEKAPAENAKALAQVRDEAGEPLPLTDEACRSNVALAASRGLRLPGGWEIHCVGPGLDWEGGSHWGVTCPYEDCPEGNGPYVSISNPTYYVVAHELCHANFGNDELMADGCAAEHGASLASSPYS